MNTRKLIILLSIPILLCLMLAGCDKDDATPTDTATYVPTPEPTETEEAVLFTPVPEPSILVNQSRGEMVSRVQRRLKDLGYLHYRPTGYFLAMTQDALRAFQEDNDNLEADGDAGKETQDELFNVAYPNRKNTSSIPGAEPPERKEPGSYGNVLVWESVAQLLQQGTEFNVYDLESDINFSMIRTGGERHMHAEPAGADDAQALSAMFSNIISGEKRPALIRFEGQTIAASIYGAPHGNDNISGNDFDGCVCIYFAGCTDEVYNMTDYEHNDNINRAAGRETN